MKFSRVWLLAIVVTMMTFVAAPALAQNGGNSGTIKIATPGTSTDNEDNEPHVPCVFRADYYGFRAGTYNVTITGVAPTGGGQLRTDTVTINSDGKGNQFQVSRTYDLTGALSGITPHPQQGYHVRYDAKRSGSSGQGSKTKVFWIDCGTSGTVGGAEVRGRTIKRLNKDAAVLGQRFGRAGDSGGSAAAGTGLARTGLDLTDVAAGGAALMALGLAGAAIARRKKN